MFPGVTMADLALMMLGQIDPEWKYTGKFSVGDEVRITNPLDATAEGADRLAETFTIRGVQATPAVKQLYGQDAMYEADAPGMEMGLFFEDELSFASEVSE